MSSIEKTIRDALSAVERNVGKGLLQHLGSGQVVEPVKTIPTGCLTLDHLLGVGGVPEGRIMEIYGPESSGKTTLALHMIAEAQKTGKLTAFIDAEHALDTGYAKKLGVNVEELLISQPDHGEQALDIASTLTSIDGLNFIVIDSVAALIPKAELEGDMGDHHVGLHARLMSQALRKLTAACNRHGTTILFINQLRHKIGVQFGSPETTTGGNALKFYASVRIDIRRIGSIKVGDEVIGNRTRIKVAKNKLAPPFRIGEVEIIFGKGFNRRGELLDLCVAAGLVEKSGSWYSLGKERLGQGRDKAVDFLAQHPDVEADLHKRLLDSWASVDKQAVSAL